MSVEHLKEPTVVFVLHEADELDRLRQIMAEMVQDQSAELVEVLRKVRRSTHRMPPLTAAFACMAIAEMKLLESGLTLNEASFGMFRQFAVDVAERMTKASAQ